MSRFRIHMACSFSDRIAALLDGTVTVPGVDIETVCLRPAEIFARALRTEEFDICEMSLSSYITERSLGKTRFTAIPVFPSRMFRHSFVLVNRSSNVREPRDLAGKTVGLQEYQMTAAVAVRGFLNDDYGVSHKDIDWVQGGQDEVLPQSSITHLLSPPGVRLRAAPPDRTLTQMLSDGELDALISPWKSPVFTNPAARRLFEDPLAVELDYYRRTNIFPIMHVIVGKTSLFEAHPWLALSLYQAFDEAKSVANKNLDPHSSYLYTMVPCQHLFVEHLRTVFGEDLWPYGLRANLPTLRAMCRWSHEQGLSPRLLDPAELFWDSTLAT